MNSRHAISGLFTLGIVCWLGAACRRGAGGARRQPRPMSEQVFKNIQVLKGIPVDQFMDAMGMFSSSLGYDCSSCHSQEIHTDRAAFAITTPLITRARQMIVMMNGINDANFGGRPRVTCFTCHRTSPTPEDVPSLAAQYADFVDDPNSMTIVRDRSVTPDQVFASTCRRSAARKGRRPHQLHRARHLRRVQHRRRGRADRDQREGAEPADTDRRRARWRQRQDVRRAQRMGGRRLASAAVDEADRRQPRGRAHRGAVVVPRDDQGRLHRWQVGSATIDDKPVQVLQGRSGGQPVNLYFDEAGLLVRNVRWNSTPVGTVPTQVDYSDYRDVAGVKMPFARSSSRGRTGRTRSR